MEVWLLLGGGIISWLGLVLAGLECGPINQLYTGNHQEVPFCSDSICC